MVSQTYGHHGDKRHYRAFSPYVGSSGYTEARVYIPPPPNTRTLMSEHQAERTEAPTRKRIAVACGRCRQRKIRCSGDLGQNIPCSNCKNAGVTQCLFLRVSSRETAIKGDISISNLSNLGSLGSLRNEFNYNPAISRALATRSSVPPPSYGSSTNTSPTSTTSPGASSHDFEYRSPLYPYKSYLSNMTPWSAGYGGDCVDYTIPTCSPYSVVNVTDSASPSGVTTSSGGVPTSQLMAYQPWDSRGKQNAVDTETTSPTMPSSSTLLPSSMPPPVTSTLPQSVQTTTTKSSGPTTPGTVPGPATSVTSANTVSTSTTNLVYRLASTTDSSDYRHAPSSIEGDLPRNSIEGIDRPPAEPLSGLPRYKASELIARSAAPSPAPIPHTIPHSVSHPIPHSVPSPLPHNTPHSVSHIMPSPSPYTGHINTASSDRVTVLGYPGSARSSPVDHSVYGTSHSTTIPDGGLFSEQDRSVGTQGASGGPSSSVSCLDSYTYEPSPKTVAVPSAVGMVRQKSKKTIALTSSTENLTKTTSTPATRVYSPAEGHVPPLMSRSSSPALYMAPYHDARSESVYVGSHSLNLQQIQHTSSRV
ncbi:hypothetical protein SEUCBS140593_008822 [Sporothrix eucalyptigena]|uniref:Zn(2)-C6 fungal-type domain-containing protein n=1 Tax=Sporothrix eucalyptigena TaxID=1812306 RepID=A0ABP0CPP2_9PEZI